MKQTAVRRLQVLDRRRRQQAQTWKLRRIAFKIPLPCSNCGEYGVWRSYEGATYSDGQRLWNTWCYVCGIQDAGVVSHANGRAIMNSDRSVM